MYADDTAISYSSDKIEEIHFVVKAELACLEKLLQGNKLFLNIIKTQAMIIGSAILNKHWSTIMKDITLNPIHQEKPIMAFKRNRNIRDILVHTKL